MKNGFLAGATAGLIAGIIGGITVNIARIIEAMLARALREITSQYFPFFPYSIG